MEWAGIGQLARTVFNHVRGKVKLGFEARPGGASSQCDAFDLDVEVERPGCNGHKAARRRRLREKSGVDLVDLGVMTGVRGVDHHLADLGERRAGRLQHLLHAEEALLGRAMSPLTKAPVARSNGGVPETKTKPLARTPGERGTPARRMPAEIPGTSMMLLSTSLSAVRGRKATAGKPLDRPAASVLYLSYICLLYTSDAADE